MMPFDRRHIKTRITMWFVAALAGVLLVYLAAAGVLQLRELRAQAIWHARQDVETVEGLLYFDAAGALHLRDDYHNHPESKLVIERLLEVRDSAGAVLLRNDLLGNRSLGDALLPGEGVGGYSERESTLPDGLKVILVSRRHAINGRPTIIRVAYSQEPLWGQFRAAIVRLLAPLPFVLLLAGFGGYYLASRLLRPVQELAHHAAELSSERLNRRLPVDPADGELAELAEVFNSVLTRLEQSFEQLRRFTSDASHELRTPLAAMRSVGEVALQKSCTGAEYRDVIGSMLEEANKLTRLVDSLLTLARADAGQIRLQPSHFEAAKLARECAGLLEVLIDEKELKLEVRDTLEPAFSISGDWLLLRQALLNVIHNAIKYSPRGGGIELRLAHPPAGHDAVAVEVQDSGPGIPQDKLPHIFDRFYRVDEGRAREVGGAGLGLAIARWAVQLHGGSVEAFTPAGGGCCVRLVLPRTAENILAR